MAHAAGLSKIQWDTSPQSSTDTRGSHCADAASRRSSIIERNLGRDWNNEVNALYESVLREDEAKHANEAKTRIVFEFVEFSAAIAESLVEQLAQPLSEWSITPLNSDAGRYCFVVDRLFCRFARDNTQVYLDCAGTNSELGVKMAKNELRHLSAVLQLDIPNMRFTLTACHRIRGHSVVTTAILPINPDRTLTYDIEHASKRVRKLAEAKSILLKRVAAPLGLRDDSARNYRSDAEDIARDGHVNFQFRTYRYSPA